MIATRLAMKALVEIKTRQEARVLSHAVPMRSQRRYRDFVRFMTLSSINDGGGYGSHYLTNHFAL
jgi:hypothetical protein